MNKNTELKFYREIESGDYLAIDPNSNDYYRDNLGEDCFEGRATVAIGLGSGINTTSISRRFLEADCEEVKRSDVPKEWLAQFE